MEQRDARWTPGPWRITRQQPNVVVNAGGDKWIARALIGARQKSPRFIKDDEVVVANACLIAAAPDLYAALAEAVEVIENCTPFDGTKAFAALAKARGEQP